jgi:hypothetical protein
MESVHVFGMELVPFRAVTLGLKTSVVLSLDLGVLVGDQIVLREWNERLERPTGAWLCRRVTHEDRATPSEERNTSTYFEGGITPGFAVYCLNNPAENEWARAHLTSQLEAARKSGLGQEAFWREIDEKERARRRILRSLE